MYQNNYFWVFISVWLFLIYLSCIRTYSDENVAFNMWVIKVIIVIKKQFSLATLTLKILQDQLFNPFLGASHILKHNGYGSHRESWVWNMEKQIWSCVVQQPVCWGPAHLGSLHIAAGYFYHLGQITSTAIPLPCWLAGQSAGFQESSKMSL